MINTKTIQNSSTSQDRKQKKEPRMQELFLLLPKNPQINPTLINNHTKRADATQRNEVAKVQGFNFSGSRVQSTEWP